MNEQLWTLEFYRDQRGRSPVENFLDEQSPGMQAKILTNLRLLEALGLRLGMPLARPVAGQGIWELRTQASGNISRVFYFAVSGRRIVLLHGFIKKTQQTPRSEIATAIRRRDEYIGRIS